MTYRYRLRFLFLGAILLVFLFLWQGAALQAATRDAMHLAACSIIPSLFPFLVLSGILSATADPGVLPGSKIFARLTHLPAQGFLAFFLGALCGFPIGARVSAELCRNGALEKREAARLAAVSTNAGPAFVVAGVGGALFGSLALGWLLFFIQLCAALLLLPFWCKRKPPRAGREFSLPQKNFSFSEILKRAVLSALEIAGAVVFFGGVAALLSAHLFPIPSALFKAVLEVGNGCAAAAALGKQGLPIAAFSLGFSGISVLFQGMGELGPQRISALPLITFKLCQGLLSALLILPFCF